jgi:hypothetical protein
VAEGVVAELLAGRLLPPRLVVVRVVAHWRFFPTEGLERRDSRVSVRVVARAGSRLVGSQQRTSRVGRRVGCAVAGRVSQNRESRTLTDDFPRGARRAREQSDSGADPTDPTPRLTVAETRNTGTEQLHL